MKWNKNRREDWAKDTHQLPQAWSERLEIKSAKKKNREMQMQQKKKNKEMNEVEEWKCKELFFV